MKQRDLREQLAFMPPSLDKAAMAQCVLTLIAGAASTMPLEQATGAAARALSQLGARVGSPELLAEGEACDLPFVELDPDQADAAARQALGGAAIDLAAQPAAGRRKSLLVADMESTIIANEMLEELAEFVGMRAAVAEITRRAMNGEIDFAAALRERVALLGGLAESVLDEAGCRIRITPGAKELVATMRRNGAYCALVSGGFTVYTSRVAEELGFDANVANALEVSAGRLTGRVVEPILAREAKLATLKRLAGERHVPLAATLAVGDGANDLPMIEAAGLGVAYHGKPAVAAAARVRIDHCDMRALLYVQGYRRDEIAG